MSSTRVKSIYTQFSKPELVTLSEELDLKSVTFDTRSKDIATFLLKDVDEKGVPELEDCSDIMLEFLHVAGYVDENGNLLEGKEIEALEEPSKEQSAEVVLPDTLPPCWSLADDRDPSCNKCKVMQACVQHRVENRPACFGMLFDQNSEECRACIEAAACKQSISKGEQ